MKFSAQKSYAPKMLSPWSTPFTTNMYSTLPYKFPNLAFEINPPCRVHLKQHSFVSSFYRILLYSVQQHARPLDRPTLMYTVHLQQQHAKSPDRPTLLYSSSTQDLQIVPHYCIAAARMISRSSHPTVQQQHERSPDHPTLLYSSSTKDLQIVPPYCIAAARKISRSSALIVGKFDICYCSFQTQNYVHVYPTQGRI